MDNNLFVCGIFIDLQKAFRTTNHNILFHKLSHYGIRDLANSWFSSELPNKKQFFHNKWFKFRNTDLDMEYRRGLFWFPFCF